MSFEVDLLRQYMISKHRLRLVYVVDWQSKVMLAEDLQQDMDIDQVRSDAATNI